MSQPKVKVVKSIQKINEGTFFVYLNGILIESFSFDARNEDEEKAARHSAIESAKKHEKFNPSEETIYESQTE